MSRVSDNIVDAEGFVKYGFDYRFQVWVKDYRVECCWHPLSMRLNGPCCNSNRYAGLDVRELYKSGKESLKG